MSKKDFSRRERQIMDIVYRLGRATAAEVLEKLADPPSYSTVRALLRGLEDKGHVRHELDGLRYVFVPSVAPAEARRSALSHLVKTFFDGSAESAMAALLDASRPKLSAAELDRLGKLIAQAKKEGR